MWFSSIPIYRFERRALCGNCRLRFSSLHTHRLSFKGVVIQQNMSTLLLKIKFKLSSDILVVTLWPIVWDNLLLTKKIARLQKRMIECLHRMLQKWELVKLKHLETNWIEMLQKGYFCSSNAKGEFFYLLGIFIYWWIFFIA